MQELEKILEEIESKEFTNMTIRHDMVVKMKDVRSIIRKYLSRENIPEITRYSRDNDCWIPVETYGLPSSHEHRFRYWVTVEYHNSFRRPELATWDYYDRCFKYTNGRKILQDVIAYKYYELPEPYRPERSNDEKK